jgi:hypothetical protein
VIHNHLLVLVLGYLQEESLGEEAYLLLLLLLLRMVVAVVVLHNSRQEEDHHQDRDQVHPSSSYHQDHWKKQQDHLPLHTLLLPYLHPYHQDQYS